MPKFCLTLFAVLVCFALHAQEETPKAPEPNNIALGKKYTISPTPTYRHCTDPEDSIQLTDGQTTSAYFWTQKGTVGWQNVPYAVIQLELEKVEPISGVDMTTAAGVAGVTWPVAAFVQVSDDGKTFRQVADLVTHDLKAKGPWPAAYAIRCLEARNLEARGRYVRIVVLSSGPFIFTDEIRIWRGDNSLLQGEAKGEIAESNVKEFVENRRLQLSIQRRFDSDFAELRKLAETVGDEAGRKAAMEKIDALEKRLAIPDPETLKNFRAVLPYDDVHAELFKVQADVWRSAGMTFHAVPVSPWDRTPLFGMPRGAGVPAKVEVHAMQGEYRAAAVNLYNATREPTSFTVFIDNPALSMECTVHDVPWTDTMQLEPVLAALPEALPTKLHGQYSVLAHPGLVKQVYFTFRPTGLKPGQYEANIVIQKAGESKETAKIPLSLKVWPQKFPEKTSLLVGGWSYTNGNGAYSVTPKNRDSFLKHLKEHFVNAPWARPSVVMNFEFDGEVAKLNTKEWDDWLAQWPDAKEYCIFLSVGPTIKGVKHDAPEFDAAVARWITAWIAHWKSQGIEPERFNLLVADEPGLDYSLAPMYAWSRAIRKAQPKLKLWTDPVYTDLSKAPTELFEVSDVICPNRPQWLGNRKGFDAFYVDGWKAKGKTLQLYSCSGPARLLDPYSYYRLQAWDVARIGGTGSFFWAFGDGGGASSWNESLSPRNMYTPLFLDPADEQVVAGKQMEAIREGIEDFETIQMLRTLIAKRKAEDKSVDDTEKTLREAIEMVLTAKDVDTIFWKDAKDRGVADRARVKILEAIEELNK